MKLNVRIMVSSLHNLGLVVDHLRELTIPYTSVTPR